MTRSRGGPGHGTLRWTRTSKQAGKVPTCHLFEKATLTHFLTPTLDSPSGAINQYYHTGTHQSLLQMNPSPKPPPVLKPSCSNPQSATTPPSGIKRRPRPAVVYNGAAKSL